MKKQNVRSLSCHVNPSDYPESRLKREHLALLKCIDDKPIMWNNTAGEQPQIGKYYLAISSGVLNSFGVLLREKPQFTAYILREDNHTRCTLFYDNFEIVEDPHGVMEKKTGFHWPLWQELKWKEAKAAMMNKQTFLYDEQFLKENRLALVRYPETAKANESFVPGRQYLAITQEPDISECVYIHILREYPDKKPEYEIAMFSAFDILSDPLGLLNPWKTDWHDNKLRQMQLRPELYA